MRCWLIQHQYNPNTTSMSTLSRGLVNPNCGENMMMLSSTCPFTVLPSTHHAHVSCMGRPTQSQSHVGVMSPFSTQIPPVASSRAMHRRIRTARRPQEHDSASTNHHYRTGRSPATRQTRPYSGVRTYEHRRGTSTPRPPIQKYSTPFASPHASHQRQMAPQHRRGNTGCGMPLAAVHQVKALRACRAAHRFAGCRTR